MGERQDADPWAARGHGSCSAEVGASATALRVPPSSCERIIASTTRMPRTASEAEKVALIRAHPELAGREAREGTLTRESEREQAAAGLGTLDTAEAAELRALNARYLDRFGFPFVICARQNRKDAIMGTLRARLANSRDQEIANAIAQIGEIARLRIADLLP
ncbi:MAG: 2-oxo-4-hydroxy-4-carboxy-5-ureidoimidazoline decarboxylase [Betaproteobacteria bacterium PRO3]|nr:2-oxo-4-hydroxy-4-carboxy-5-ureidoimidazoline decarboxylase [Betaproteobacteria bacterium PRO3]